MAPGVGEEVVFIMVQSFSPDRSGIIQQRHPIWQQRFSSPPIILLPDYSVSLQSCSASNPFPEQIGQAGGEFAAGDRIRKILHAEAIIDFSPFGAQFVILQDGSGL